MGFLDCFGGLMCGRLPGSDNRRAAIWAWMWQFLGTLMFSARACYRELITHTHAWIKEFQTIKEIFCVKTPMVLSKNICAYPSYNSLWGIVLDQMNRGGRYTHLGSFMWFTMIVGNGMGVTRWGCWAFVWRGCGILRQIVRGMPGVLITHWSAGKSRIIREIINRLSV